jgi:integrase
VSETTDTDRVRGRPTASAYAKAKPKKKRWEKPDGGGLYCVIFPSGAKSWALRYRQNGKSQKLTLGPWTDHELEDKPVIGQPLTLAAARALATQVKRELELGHDPIANRKAEKLRRRQVAAKAADNTFLSAARYYIEHGRKKRTAKGLPRNRGWRATALVLGLAYEDGGEPTLIKGGLAERWHDKPVSEITAEDIFVAVDEATTKGIPGRRARNSETSNARGHEMVSALSAMFRYLLGKRRVAFNPCLGIARPEAPAARDRVLNCKADVRGGDEVRWLWAACDGVGAPMGALAKLLLLTGQRRSEVAEMVIEELSDDLSTWRIPASRTKNGRPHEVPLSPLAQTILADLIGDRKAGYVFVSGTGDTALTAFSKGKRKLDEAMLKAAREENKNAVIPPWRLHDLRRTAVTGMVELDIAPHVVEAVVNHVSGHKGGVAGIYNRSTMDKQKRDALENWATYIQALTTPKVVPIKRREAL